MNGGYDDLARALGHATHGDTFKARCPCHDDDAPSLSVTRTDSGGFVAKCHAGCDQRRVFDACRELAGDRPREQPRRFEHVYRTADGEVFATKIRTYLPDGSKRMAWDRKLNGRPAPLYRLPELIEAGERGARVFVVEGERKVEQLERLGLVATSPPSGGSAGAVGKKWRDEWSRYFAGLEVVILADSDEPGRVLANHVAQRLQEEAFEVRVLELAPPRGGAAPKGYDVSDWLADGGTLEQLEQLVARVTPGQILAIEQAPPAAPPRGDLPDLNDDDHEWGSEEWFGRRIVAEHGANIRYVGPWKKWMAYDPTRGRWAEASNGEVIRAGTATARALASEAARFADEVGRGGNKSLIAAAQSRLKVAKKFLAFKALEQATRFAAAHVDVVASPEQWDRDAMLFAVANGVVELATGQLRAARQDDYLVLGSPVVYDPAATCSTWLAFLSRVIPDPEQRAYLQRLCGFSLTARTDEHTLHVLYGQGANGKSTFTDTWSYVLGGYSVAAPASLMLKSKNERHPTEMANLHKRRLALASESPADGKLDEERVKSLTGGDRVPARRMREDWWDFEPTHKLVLSTNHRPRIAGTDRGIWRRVRLVPFTVTIPEAEWDRGLKGKLRAEAAGVLAWMVAGLHDFLARGSLDPPASVLSATEDYRREEDELAEWIEDELLAIASARTPVQRVYENYTAWASAEGVPERFQVRPKTLTKRLLERGYVVKRNHGGMRVWEGVALREDVSDAPVRAGRSEAPLPIGAVIHGYSQRD